MYETSPSLKSVRCEECLKRTIVCMATRHPAAAEAAAQHVYCWRFHCATIRQPAAAAAVRCLKAGYEGSLKELSSSGLEMQATQSHAAVVILSWSDQQQSDMELGHGRVGLVLDILPYMRLQPVPSTSLLRTSGGYQG